jgi:uncharacterized protein (TIGR03437 family)
MNYIFNYKRDEHGTYRPFVKVALNNGGKQEECYAIVDSGADYCVFPSRLIEKLALNPADVLRQSETEGYGSGQGHPTRFWHLAINIEDDAGQVSADGNGNLTITSTANVGGAVSNITGTGTYSVSNDCHGTASIKTQAGSSNYVLAIVQDGSGVLFVETDAGTTVGGSGQPQFSAPAQAIVNGASFESQMAAPGSLFSIFGTGLSSQSASAQTTPLPIILGQTQVLVNGTPAPLLYVAEGQINAQMPVGVPTGQSVSVTVTNAGMASNTVALSIPPAAPGLFTYDGNQAIVQNPNGSLNSSTSPAHPGDVLVAYLTGGGSVNSGSWTSGEPSPDAPASVTAAYSLTVGNQPANVAYVGLTPGFVGLYQANFTLPTLTPGTYSVVVTVAGNASNPATIAVGG